MSASADFTTSTAAGVLAGERITPVTATPFLDIDVLGSLDPQYRFFSHDKVEGVAAQTATARVTIHVTAG